MQVKTKGKKIIHHDQVGFIPAIVFWKHCTVQINLKYKKNMLNYLYIYAKGVRR